MPKMTNQNLRSIKLRFEEHTGVDLNPAHRVPLRRCSRRILLLAAVLVIILSMLAFTPRLFSPLDNDKLSLGATYEGNGILSIHVENGSDKPLRFQEQTRLIRWVTGEEVSTTGGRVYFENTVFPPHTSGTMTVDLSQAYDVEALENAKTNIESYYLLLTNNEFLFGHDWICSFTFRQPEKEAAPEEKPDSVPIPAALLENVETELRFYFEKAYNAPLSLNEANFQYQQKVDELLKRFPGTVVCALSPSIMVAGPSEYLDPEPMVRDVPAGVILDTAISPEAQHLLTSWEWKYTDAYGRFVATAGEQAMVQYAMLPQSASGKSDPTGGVAIPLIFRMVYDVGRASNPENYAFIYGQLLTFEELEPCLVLRDEHYAIYDITDLIYTDVDAYLDYYLTTRTDVYCDDQLRQRVHNVYNYFHGEGYAADLIRYRGT